MQQGATETQDDAPRAERAALTPALPQLYVVLECDRIAAGSARFALDGVGEVRIGRGAVRRVLREARDGVVGLRVEVPSAALSREHARLVRRHGHWVLEDLGSKNGSYVAGAKVSRHGLSSGGGFELGRVFFELVPEQATPEGTRDFDAAALGSRPAELSSAIPLVDRRLAELATLAPSPLPLLLVASSGAEAHSLAQAVHAVSGRAGSFVHLAPAMLGNAELELRLFGRTAGGRGAPPAELGLLRSAAGGTLCLDAVEELHPAARALVLGFLATNAVTPLGAATAEPVESRAIGVTFRPVASPELAARLGAHVHVVVPLAERRSELGSFVAASFTATGKMAPGIEPEAARRLLAHTWPGDRRELAQVVSAAAVLAGGASLRLDHLPATIGATAAPRADDADDAERRAALETALWAARGNVAEVARGYGKAPTQIHRWMKRWGLDAERFRPR